MFCIFTGVKEVDSKYSRISRSLINFLENYHFRGDSSALEIAFQIQAFFKEFKDLQEL